MTDVQVGYLEADALTIGTPDIQVGAIEVLVLAEPQSAPLQVGSVEQQVLSAATVTYQVGSVEQQVLAQAAGFNYQVGSVELQVLVSPTGGIPPTAYAAEVTADGPINYWRLEEASGKFYDYYGNLDGTPVGNPSRQQPGAEAASKGVAFPTVADYVQFGAVASLHGASKQAWSAECWFKVSTLTQVSTGQSGYVIYGTDCAVDSFSNNAWSFLINRTTGHLSKPKGYLYGSVAVGSTRVFPYSTQALDDDIWHHLVLTYDGANARLYVDGTLHQAVAQTGNTNNGAYPATIGLNQVFAPNPAAYPANIFPGTVDEVAFYRKVLTPDRILAHYQAMSQTPAGPTWTVWNGSAEVAATPKVWNGTSEVAVTTEIT